MTLQQHDPMLFQILRRIRNRWKVQQCLHTLIHWFIAWILFCVLIVVVCHSFGIILRPILWITLASIALGIFVWQCLAKDLSNEKAALWCDQQTQSQESITSYYWIILKIQAKKELHPWEILVEEHGKKRLEAIRPIIERKLAFHFAYQQAAYLLGLFLLAVSIPIAFHHWQYTSLRPPPIPEEVNQHIVYGIQILQERDPALSRFLTDAQRRWQQNPPGAEILQQEIQAVMENIAKSQKQQQDAVLRRIQQTMDQVKQNSISSNSTTTTPPSSTTTPDESSTTNTETNTPNILPQEIIKQLATMEPWQREQVATKLQQEEDGMKELQHLAAAIQQETWKQYEFPILQDYQAANRAMQQALRSLASQTGNSQRDNLTELPESLDQAFAPIDDLPAPIHSQNIDPSAVATNLTTNSTSPLANKMPSATPSSSDSQLEEIQWQQAWWPEQYDAVIQAYFKDSENSLPPP